MFFARSSPSGTASPRTPMPWHVPPLLWVQKKPGHPASLIIVGEKRCRPLLGEWIVRYHQLRHGAIL